jgi:hypothetical protein
MSATKRDRPRPPKPPKCICGEPATKLLAGLHVCDPCHTNNVRWGIAPKRKPKR